MKIAYIISPYRATGKWNKPVIKWLKILWNIYKARKIALIAWGQGYAPICPQSNSALFDLINKDIPDEVYLTGYIEMMKKCDVIYVANNWISSAGCRKEVAIAMHLKSKEMIMM